MLRRIQHGSHEGVTLHSVSIYLYDGRHGQQDTRMRCGILGSHIKEAMRNIKTAMHCQSTHRSWLMNLNEDASASARTLPRYSSPAPTIIARTCEGGEELGALAGAPLPGVHVLSYSIGEGVDATTDLAEGDADAYATLIPWVRGRPFHERRTKAHPPQPHPSHSPRTRRP